MDAMFFGFGVCNVAIAALLYPVSTDKAVLAFQNLVFTLFLVAFESSRSCSSTTRA